MRPRDRPGLCLCPSGGLCGNPQDPLAPLEPGCRYRALPNVAPYTGGWNARTRCAYCVITPRTMSGLDGRGGRCLCMCDLCGPLADYDGRGLQLSMNFSGLGRAARTGTLGYHGESQTALTADATLLFEDIEVAYADWPDLRPSLEDQMDMEWADAADVAQAAAAAALRAAASAPTSAAPAEAGSAPAGVDLFASQPQDAGDGASESGWEEDVRVSDGRRRRGA